ncbi:hypothetical protein B566_EDAN012046 [Ephemera danica]|nr:hypothetical protein B566_EDAN012046 [Ephemera danica]
MAATMQESLAFKDNFWSSELGNYNSYDMLLKRIKDAQKSTKEFFEFMKQRYVLADVTTKILTKNLTNQCIYKNFVVSLKVMKHFYRNPSNFFHFVF